VRKNEEKSRASQVALLIIDVVTDFKFEDGDKLLVQAMHMAPHLAELKKKVKAANIPVIYINDNFGKWQEDFKTTLKYCLRSSSKGKNFVDLLKPDNDDFYILKPHRSAFYTTALEVLLQNLGVSKLILTGLTTDICILFTANDAYMRSYELFIPQDCVCAITPQINKSSLQFISRVLKADVKLSDKIDIKSLSSGANSSAK